MATGSASRSPGFGSVSLPGPIFLAGVVPSSPAPFAPVLLPPARYVYQYEEGGGIGGCFRLSDYRLLEM